jgi:hypothetical protein
MLTSSLGKFCTGTAVAVSTILLAASSHEARASVVPVDTVVPTGTYTTLTSVSTINGFTLTLDSYAYVDPTQPDQVDFYYRVTSDSGSADVKLESIAIGGWGTLTISAYTLNYSSTLGLAGTATGPAATSASISSGVVTFGFNDQQAKGAFTTDWFEIKASPLDATGTTYSIDAFKKTTDNTTLVLTAGNTPFVVTVASAIPEPSTCLFGAALIGAVVTQRRRQRLA